MRSAKARAAVSALAVATIVGLSGCSGGTQSSGVPKHSPSASTTHGPTPSAGSTPGTKPAAATHHDPKLDPKTKAAARRGASRYIETIPTLLASPRKNQATSGLPIAGDALAAVLAMRDEYASKKYRTVGAPRIVNARVTDRHMNPPELVITACVDNSAVKVLDKRGQRVAAPDSPKRARNEYTLRKRRKTNWIVVESTFAKDPYC